MDQNENAYILIRISADGRKRNKSEKDDVICTTWVVKYRRRVCL